MGLFKKKESDPISERERALNAEIAALELKIKALNSAQTAKPTPAQPKLRPATLPHGSSHPTAASPPKPPASSEHIFEEVDQSRLKSGDGGLSSEEHARHFNDLGVRKYDLNSLIQRIKNHLRGPTAPNRLFVTYLAAGSVQGLRPLRYEKRVARNRVFAMVLIILVILVGSLLFMKWH